MSKISVLAIAIAVLAIGAPARAEKVLQGEVCSARVHQLTTDIYWHKNLEEAEALAREQGKLVVWVHMLGKIDGAT